MKTLILVRHAKSSWDDPSLSDHDRPLNKRGLHDAPIMGKRLNKKSIIPDFMLSSSANRALSTCKIIAEQIQYPATKIVADKTIYHAGEDELLSVVQQLEDTDSVVMLFGHNPGFTYFANSLTKSNIDNIPTCGVVACLFDIERWKEVSWGMGKVQFFDFPKNSN